MLGCAPVRRFRRLFIANRGEVAARIARTCDSLGITPVFGVSEADRDAPYTRNRESVLLGPSRSSESYLAAERIVQAAVQTRCSAIHPGWGFLAENPLFASLCGAHGVTFIGPLTGGHAASSGARRPPSARWPPRGSSSFRAADGVLRSVEEAKLDRGGNRLPRAAQGRERWRRVVACASFATPDPACDEAYESAQAESLAAFGDGRLYLEKLIEGGRHIEIQLLADEYGNVVHLGERDCSVQRKHQKLIEESPGARPQPSRARANPRRGRSR